MLIIHYWIQDPPFLIFQLLKQLLRLYNNLPAKLQSRKKEISAAELIFKAIEFITLLREVLALNPEDETNNEDTDVHNEDDEGISRNDNDNYSYSNELHEHQPNKGQVESRLNSNDTASQHYYEHIIIS